MPKYMTIPMKELGGQRFTFETEKPVTSPEEYRQAFINAYRGGTLTPVVESDPLEVVNTIARIGAASVLPVAGGAVGTYFGGPVLGAIGAGLGEKGNQALGITPESNLQAALAAAGPAIPALIGVAGSQIPGAAVGIQQGLFKMLGREGAKIIEQMVTKAGPSRPLFQQVEQRGATLMITPTNLAQAAKELGTELSTVVPEFTPRGATRLVRGAEKLTGGGEVSTQFGPMPQSMLNADTSVPFNVFRQNQQGLGEKMRSAIAQGGEGAGIAKRLYGAMWDDMEALTANTPGPLGKLLAQAVAARKQEEAASMLREMWQTGATRQSGFQNLNFDTILTKVDNAKDVFTRLLGPEGYTDLQARLEDLARTNYPQIQRGLQTGQQVNYTTRAIVGGSLGLAGANFLAPGVGATGQAVGVGGGALATVVVAETLSHLLASTPGRQIIAELTRHGATYQQIVAAGLQLGRVALTGDPSGGSSSFDLSGLMAPTAPAAPLPPPAQ